MGVWETETTQAFGQPCQLLHRNLTYSNTNIHTAIHFSRCFLCSTAKKTLKRNMHKLDMRSVGRNENSLSDRKKENIRASYVRSRHTVYTHHKQPLYYNIQITPHQLFKFIAEKLFSIYIVYARSTYLVSFFFMLTTHLTIDWECLKKKKEDKRQFFQNGILAEFAITS